MIKPVLFKPVFFVSFGVALFSFALASAQAAGISFTEKHTIFTTDAPLLGGGNYVVARVGDLNHDGVADLLIGEPNFNNNTGRVRVISGQNGCLIGTVPNATSSGAGSYFGNALADVGDINGDGRTDFAVGAPIHSSTVVGHVYIFSGIPISGGFAKIVDISGTGSGDHFGDALAAADLNGDGAKELIVGAPQKSFSTVSQKGYARVFNLATWASGGFIQTKVTLLPSSPSDGNTDFGDTLTIIQDLNGDTRPEIVVGAPWDSAVSNGFVELFSGLSAFQGSASPMHRINVPVDSGSQGGPQDFAYSLSGLGDVNGNGFPELGVAAPGEDVSGSNDIGTVRIFSITPNGLGGFQSSVIYKLTGSKSIHADIGDIYPFGAPDGRSDLFVGNGNGSMQLLDGATGSLVKQFSSGLANNSWGTGVQAYLGDISADGIPEVVVAGDGSSATVAALSLNFPFPSVSLATNKYSMSAASGGTATFRLDAGPIVGGLSYLLLATVSGTTPGVQLTSPYVVSVPINFDAVTNAILAAPNSPPWSNGLGTLDLLGQAQASFTLPSGITSPLCIHHAFVVLDGSFRVQGSSNPVVLNVVP